MGRDALPPPARSTWEEEEGVGVDLGVDLGVDMGVGARVWWVSRCQA